MNDLFKDLRHAKPTPPEPRWHVILPTGEIYAKFYSRAAAEFLIETRQTIIKSRISRGLAADHPQELTLHDAGGQS